MSLQFMFLFTGIVLAFVTIINYNNWGTTHNEQWYYLAWVTIIISLGFIIISFFIDKEPAYHPQRKSI